MRKGNSYQGSYCGRRVELGGTGGRSMRQDYVRRALSGRTWLGLTAFAGEWADCSWFLVGGERKS